MPVFGYGDMRLYLLKLLDEAPRYGYELIRLLEDRFLGAYTPSAGAIYPRLAALEEEGLVEHVEEDGRKVYRLTDKGRSELSDRMGDMNDIEERLARWAGDLAKGVLDDVTSSLFGRRHDARAAVREARSAVRDARREHRDHLRDARAARRSARAAGRDKARSLAVDLEAFVADVGDAIADWPPDRETGRKVQQILLETRHAILDLLEPAEQPAEQPAAQPDGPSGAAGPTGGDPGDAAS